MAAPDEQATLAFKGFPERTRSVPPHGRARGAQQRRASSLSQPPALCLSFEIERWSKEVELVVRHVITMEEHGRAGEVYRVFRDSDGVHKEIAKLWPGTKLERR